MGNVLTHSSTFLFLKKQFVWCLAYSWCQSCGGIAYWDDDDGFLCLWHLKEVVATLGVEVTYPARTKPLLRGGKAKMLHSNGDIDVAVRLAVSSHPFLFVQDRGKDVERRFVKPRT